MEIILMPLFTENQCSKAKKDYIKTKGLSYSKLIEQKIFLVEGYKVLDSPTVKCREEEIWLGSYIDNRNLKIYNPILKLQWNVGLDDNEFDFTNDFEMAIINSTVNKSSSAVIKEASDLSESVVVNECENVESPYIPLMVYENLPKFLKSLTDMYFDRREKDMVLLTTLALLSSCFPYHQGYYGDICAGANLLLFISAPASSGKGVINGLRKLVKPLQEDLDKAYNKSIEQFTLRNKEAIANGIQLFEPKPKRKHFFIPANNSSSKLIEVMSTNKKFAVIMETEADTLIQALKNDWGNYSDTIRKSFHHEPVEMQRKREDEYIAIERSFLSAVLTGTPNQVVGLLNDVENGLFSRVMFYEFSVPLDWRNVFDRGNDRKDETMNHLANDLRAFSQRLNSLDSELNEVNKELAILFSLTSQQQSEFNNWFSEQIENYAKSNGEEFVPTVKRMGLICFRIALIFSAIRNMNSASISNELICCDVDFKNAKDICSSLLTHASKVYNRIVDASRNASSRKQKEMYLFYNNLPSDFSTHIYLKVANELSINAKTAEYRIAKYINDGTLMRISYGQYKKVA